MPPRKKRAVAQPQVQEHAPTDTAQTQRELLYTYHRTVEPVYIATGVTTDSGLMDMYGHVLGMESDAWLLEKLGLLPDWWQLVDIIEARNLTNFPDMNERPEADADQRLNDPDLSPYDRAVLKRGWRVMQTSGGGRIFRLPDRTPIIRDIKVIAVLDSLPIKDLGPTEPYMAKVA